MVSQYGNIKFKASDPGLMGPTSSTPAVPGGNHSGWAPRWVREMEVDESPQGSTLGPRQWLHHSGPQFPHLSSQLVTTVHHLGLGGMKWGPLQSPAHSVCSVGAQHGQGFSGTWSWNV